MICHSKLQPNGGLGNKIFVWSYGLVFSKINACSHYTTNWVEFQIGPILRGQSKLRFYMGYFKSEPIINRAKLYFNKSKKGALILRSEDSTLKIGQSQREEKVYTFYKVAEDWHTAYDVIKPYRAFIKKEFEKIIAPRVFGRFASHDLPVLSLHIRKGDFKKLEESETLNSSLIATQTPNSYFKKVITDIRNFIGVTIPVTIFTDGKEDEIQELLSMDKVKMAKDDLDIVHLLLLSKSKIIVFSEGSTFSGWAGFLSDAILIRNKQHYQIPVRGEDSQSFYEGCLPENNEIWPELLKDNLRKLSSEVSDNNIS